MKLYHASAGIQAFRDTAITHWFYQFSVKLMDDRCYKTIFATPLTVAVPCECTIKGNIINCSNSLIKYLDIFDGFKKIEMNCKIVCNLIVAFPPKLFHQCQEFIKHYRFTNDP